MGLTDTGLASQAAISMDNNYNQYVMGAKSQAEAEKADAAWQYQQSLADINAAEASAKIAADQQAQQNFLSMLGMAESGQYNNEYLQYMGAAYGLTEPQMNSILSANNSTGTTKKDKEYQGILAQALMDAETFTGTRGTFENYLKATELSEEDIAKVLQNYDKNGINSKYSEANLDAMFNTAMNTGGNINIEDYEYAKDNGYITESKYNQYKDEYNDAVDVEKYFDAAGENKALAEKMLNNAQKDKWLSEETIKAIEARYKELIKKLSDQDETTLSGYGVNTDNTKTTIDPSKSTRANVYNVIDVVKSKGQNEYIDRILEVSKNWGNDKNGTLVNFNYNVGNPKGEIFVFWNGKWYLTDFKGANDAKKTTGAKAVYGVEKNDKYADFYDAFNAPLKKYGGTKGGSAGVAPEVKE
jgi:hypothetical protein